MMAGSSAVMKEGLEGSVEGMGGGGGLAMG